MATTFTVGDYKYTVISSTAKTVSVEVVDKTKSSYNNIYSTVTNGGTTYKISRLESCFEGCTNLITAPSITGSYIEFMKYCFWGCTSLTTAPTLPNSVTDISYCFRGCTSLTTAPTIPDNVTDMQYCFWGCTSLTTAPTIPNNVENMILCFYNCTSLTTAPTIPNNVWTLNSCFANCTGITTAPTIGNHVENMAQCFSGCISLTTAPIIPNSVTSMSSCFKGCTSLTTAPIIPNSVTSMSNCFDGCTALTTVPTLPNSITDMGTCFRGCTSLTTAPTIPNSVTTISVCFANCTSLTTAPTIPNNVIYMSSSFSGCISLTTTPTIPNSVTNMAQCFSGCISLTTASTIPNSVIYMRNCFNGCTALTTVSTIGTSVTDMSNCFKNCTSLTTAPTIPNSVTDMSNCFYGCTSLATAPTIPNSVTNMKYCFYGCTSLTTASTIPNSVIYMSYCFNGCTSLTGHITINTSLDIYSYCFYDTEKGIILEGTSPNLQALVDTANNNNVYVGSIPLSYYLIAERVASDGATSPDPTGVYAHIQQTINWSVFTYNNIDSIVLKDNSITQSITWYTDAQKTSSINLPNWHPASNVTIHSWISIDDYTHNLSVSVSDEYTTGADISFVIPQAFRTIDFQAGGKEIAFGSVADDNVSGHLNGLFKCNMDAVFKQEFNVDGDITSGGDIEDGTGNILADKLDALGILDLFYPVGSYYETSVPSTVFNPNTAWGGTWKLETAGHVHVSAGTGYSINHADDTSGGGTTVGTRDGGEDQITYTPTGSNTAVTLTGAQSGVQAHKHTASASGGKVGSHAHEPSNTDYQFMACEGTSSAALGRYKIKQGTGSQTEHYFVSSATSVARYNATKSVQPSFTQPTITVDNATAKDATKSHNHTFTGTQVQLDNMQPYIVVNRWHRTA